MTTQSKIGKTENLIIDYENGFITLQFPYNKDLSNTLKIAYQARWFMDAEKNGKWIISSKYQKTILRDLETAPYNIIQTKNFQALKNKGEDLLNPEQLEAIETSKTDLRENYEHGRVVRPPYHYQALGVQFAEDMGGRVIIGDSPGVGKTTTALAFSIKQDGPTIIVCPANIKYVWRDELEVVIPDATHFIIEGRKAPEVDLTQYEYIIVNYDVLKWQLPNLTNLNAKTLIFDEAHAMKNVTAQRTKAGTKLAETCDNVLLLTGTPMINTAVDLYPLLRILKPDDYPNYIAFAERYGDPKEIWVNFRGRRTKRRVYQGASNLDELRVRLQPLMIRRKKEEVLQELPEKTRSNIRLDLPKKAQTEYNKMQKDFIRWLVDQGRLEEARRANRAKAVTMMSALKKFTIEHKFDFVCDMIDERLENNEKLIIFSNYREPLDKLKEKYGDAALLVNGDTPKAERSTIQKDFQTNPDRKIFLGQLQATSEGLTLTAASTTIFYDLSWSPKDHEQGENRNHRPGLKNPVNIYYLITRKTIEETIYSALMRKIDNIEAALDRKETHGETEDSVINETMQELFDN